MLFRSPEGSIDYLYGNPSSKLQSKFTNTDFKTEDWIYEENTIKSLPSKFSNKRFQSITEDTFIFNTYFLKDAQQSKNVRSDVERIKNILSSTNAWIFDTTDNEYYAVLPTDTSFEEKRDKYNTRIYYQLKFKKSKDFTRR